MFVRYSSWEHKRDKTVWCVFIKLDIQWWFVNPDTFVPSQYFRINKFFGLLKRPSVQKRKSVPALFVRISEISGLSEPGLTNHHCTSYSWIEYELYWYQGHWSKVRFLIAYTFVVTFKSQDKRLHIQDSYSINEALLAWNESNWYQLPCPLDGDLYDKSIFSA